MRRIPSCGLPRLASLGSQPVGALEVLAGMGDHLLVGGVVDRLDTDDLFAPGRIMGIEMLDELALGQPRSHDQHLAGIGDRLGDLVIIMLVLGGMTVGIAAAVVMQMDMGVLGQDAQGLHILGIEMIHASLVMVDPDDGMVMGQGNAPLQ